MKNPGTSSLLAAGLATAISGTALANETGTPPLIAGSSEVTNQVQGKVASTVEQTERVRYDAGTNTLIVRSSTAEQDKTLSEKKAVEEYFSCNLNVFNPAYEGDLSVFDTFPEVTGLINQRNSVLEIQKNVHSEGDLKIVNKELLALSGKITQARERAYTRYMEEMREKIATKLPTYAERIAYVQTLNPQNANLVHFTGFFHASLGSDKVNETSSYQDVSYISEETRSSLANNLSEVKTSYSEEEQERYRNGFLNLKDVHKIHTLTPLIQESNVLDYLADTNNSGEVSDKDTGVFYGKQLSALLHDTEAQMVAEGKGEEFYRNLSHVFHFGGKDVSFKNRSGLVAFLQMDPLAKSQFIDALHRLNISGTDIGYVLWFGPSGLAKWENVKKMIYKDPLIGNFVKKIQEGLVNLPNEIARLRSEGLIADQEYTHMLDVLEKSKNDPNFEEQILSQALNLFSSFTASYFSARHGGIQASYSNTLMSLQSTQMAKDFVDSLELSTGVYKAETGNMLMLGLTYKGTKRTSDTGALTFSTGINFGLGGQKTVLPVLSLGHISSTNAVEIKNAQISGFDLDEKSFKIGASLSLANTRNAMVGFGFKFSGDKRAAIEKKTTELSLLLDGAFACDTSLSLEACMKQIRATLATDKYEKLAFLGESLSEMETRLYAFNFDSVSGAEKRKLFQEESMFYITKFLNSQASKEEEKGWTVSGWGLGLSIIARAVTGGIPVIPGVEISKTSMKYAPSVAKKVAGALAEQKGIGETLTLDKNSPELGKNLENMLSIPGLQVSYENGYITMRSTSPNLVDFLSQNGIGVRMGISERTLSQISYTGDSLILGDVGNISRFSTLSATGKKTTIILGARGSERTEPLSPALGEILQKHSPTPLQSNITFTYGTTLEQQTGTLGTENIGLGIF